MMFPNPDIIESAVLGSNLNSCKKYSKPNRFGPHLIRAKSGVFDPEIGGDGVFWDVFFHPHSFAKLSQGWRGERGE